MTSPLTPEERAALRERVDELREDGHKRLPDWVDRLLDERDSLERRAKSAEARLEQAREALRRFDHPALQHRARCARYSVPQDVCDCGLGDLRAALESGAGL